MLFNSPEFILFLLLVYAAYLMLPFRQQNYLLLIASYIFYGWWDPRFLFLLAFSTTVDFWVGLTMEHGRLSLAEKVKPAIFIFLSAILFLGVDLAGLFTFGGDRPDLATLIRPSIMGWVCAGTAAYVLLMFCLYCILIRLPESRRRYFCLMISVVTQIGLLGTFKYFNFFVDSAVVALNKLGIPTASLHLEIVLPVGISFYTFQSLSYAIDIYRRELKPTNRFFDFALFVAYFPQLQAGPISRARDLIPQLASPRSLSVDQTARGVYLIVLGLFKKVAIADGVAPVVDQVFGSEGLVTWIDVVVGTVLFAVQIYCDFSGYSDIARGVSKLFGVDLVVNFNLPYFAKNPQDFWRRWHISLSTWLRDYLYIPLGGNHGNLAFVCRNLMITMLLGGLWHGAAWNYVLWGFYHGSLLCAFRVWDHYRPGKQDRQRGILFTLAAIAGFFIVTCYGWLLFRARSLSQVIDFTGLLFTDFGNFNYGAGVPRLSAILGIALLIMLEIIQYWRNDPHYYRHFYAVVRGAAVAAMLLFTAMGMSNEPAQFIYFQF